MVSLLEEKKIDMHMHLDAGYRIMRTTIEIPDLLRKKLILEAAENNQKGFSEIVVYALDEYFKKEDFGANSN